MPATIAKHASQKSVIFKESSKPVHKAEPLSIAQTSGSKPRRPLMRERSTTTTKTKLRYHRSAGLSAQASCWANTSITRCGAMAASDGLLELRWMVVTRLQRSCSNTTAATGTGAGGVSQTAAARSSTAAKPEKTATLPQRRAPGRSERPATASSTNWSKMTKKRRTPCPSRKRRPTRTRSSTISSRTKTKPRRTRPQTFSLMKTRTCQFR